MAPGAGFVLCFENQDVGLPTWALIEVRPGQQPLTRASSESGLVPEDHFVMGIAFRAHAGFLWADELLERTTDGGQSFSEVRPSEPARGSFDHGSLLSADHAYLVGTSIGNYSGVFETQEGGTSWSRIASWPYDWGT